MYGVVVKAGVSKGLRFYGRWQTPETSAVAYLKISVTISPCGGNGAYAKAVLNLIVSGNVNLSYRYAPDEDNDFHSELGDKNEGTLGLSVEAKIETGLRVVVVEAFFSAEAKILAESCFALDKKQEKI